MKVLWFANTPAGGAAHLGVANVGGGWLASLDRTLAGKVDLHVAFPYVKYADPFSAYGTHYHPICSRNWRKAAVKRLLHGPWGESEALSQCLAVIDEVEPDLIHIHGTENFFYGLLAKTDRPSVISMQGCITVCRHKFLSGIERRGLNIGQFSASSPYDLPYYKSFRKAYGRFARMAKHETEALSRAAHVIGRTDWDRRILKVLAPQSEYHEGQEILRNSFYHHRWCPHEGKKLIIHTTNGNSPYKGFEALCYALSLLNGLGLQVEWRVAGIRPSDLIVKVAKKVLGEHYPDRGLVLLGPLNEAQLVERLLEADLYVMPSHIENSPNNLCEAMILGMPCIATFAGGTGSLLRDGEEGVLIQDGDPWALAGAILELNKDRALAAKMGENARRRALQRHDRASIVESLLKTYAAIAGPSR